MGEFQKKWFQIVWAILLIASLAIRYIQRYIDAAWAHSQAMDIFDSVLMWITFPLTIILFVGLCAGYWRQSERLFWRMLRRWGGALAIGIGLVAVLLLVIRFAKNGEATIAPDDRQWIVATFAIGMLIYLFAKHKFQSWCKKE